MIEKRISVVSVIKEKSIEIKNVTSKKWPQILSSFAAILCFLSNGLHFGWSSPSIPQLTSPNSTITVTEDQLSWIVTSQPLGDFLGAPIGAYLSDVIGPKKTILLTTIPQIVAWLMIAFAQTPQLLIAARFISGIGEGAIYICVPIYIGEVVEPKIRGRMGSAATLLMFTGIGIINVIGSNFSIRNTALIALSVPILTICLFSFMPESPYYSLRLHDKQKAERNLKFLRHIPNVDDELDKINDSVQAQMKNPTTFKTLFMDRANRKALITLGFLRIFQQSCGTSAIVFFLIPIFNMSNVMVSPVIATVIYSGLQMGSSLVCTLIVDIFGRKPLMLISLVGASISLYTLSVFFFIKTNLHYDVSAYSLIPLIALLSFSIIFNVGYGTIPILLLSEYFPSNVKTKALCLLHFIVATMFFLASRIFLLLMNSFGVYVPFLLFGTSAFLAIFFTYLFVPETKGKSLQDIQDWFNKR